MEIKSRGKWEMLLPAFKALILGGAPKSHKHASNPISNLSHVPSCFYLSALANVFVKVGEAVFQAQPPHSVPPHDLSRFI